MMILNRHVLVGNKSQVRNCLLAIKRSTDVSAQDELFFIRRNLSTFSMISVESKQKLKETAKHKLLLINEQYEQFAGIAEIRAIQNKVLEAESTFVDFTKKRMSCQNKIDELKLKLHSIKDKLELMPKSSDGYLNLITSEHKLLREQIALDDQLVQLKEKEQLAFDTMSKLLRQSHECERLRHDRSKYWNIITLMLSFGCSSIALIAQKIRGQNYLKLELVALKSEMDSKFTLMENELIAQNESFKSLDEKSDRILNAITDMRVKKSSYLSEGVTKEMKQHSGWLSYIPGLTTIISWL